MRFYHDSIAHAYFLDGRRILSNTEVIERMGFSDYTAVPEHVRKVALEIGTDVSEATDRADRGKSLKKYQHVIGYVEAWRSFKRDYRFRPRLIEEPLLDPIYRIGTRPDRWGDSVIGPITVQIKIGHVQPWVALQTAFEERCIALRNGETPTKSTDRRFGVQLSPNGTIRVTRFFDPNDIVVFLSAATCLQWQIAAGIKKL